ncbi:MAG: Circoviridae 2 [Cyanobacteriota bacterium]
MFYLCRLPRRPYSPRATLPKTRSTLSGRGKYSVAKFSRDVKTLLGKKLSRALTNDAISIANAGTALATGKITGSGSYLVSPAAMVSASNNLITGLSPHQNSVPRVSDLRDEQGAIMITHSEYVTDIYGPNISFANNAFFLNPGIEKTFPWLSQVAQNFEEYEFLQLIFSFVSTITDIGSSTNGQCGTVTLATDYNPNHNPFADKQEMLAYAHSHSTKASQDMHHGVECDPRKTSGSARKYIRAYGLSASEDLKTYDLGLFQLAVNNIPTSLVGQQMGELRVTYKVILRKPKLFVGRGLGISRDLFVQPSTQARGAIANYSNTWPGAGTVYKGAQNSLGSYIVGGPGGQYFDIVFPDGYSGQLRFTVIVKLIQNATSAWVWNINTSTLLGIAGANVARINEFYAESLPVGAQPTWLTSVDLPATAQANQDALAVGCVYVRQSQVSGANFVRVYSMTGGPYTNLIQIMVQVEEYNSYDKTLESQSNNLINIASNVEVAGPTI